MEDDYTRILENVKDDPGTAGNQGEENWKELFENWLPPIFQIVTKGRILGAQVSDLLNVQSQRNYSAITFVLFVSYQLQCS